LPLTAASLLLGQIVFLDIIMPDFECAEFLEKVHMLSHPPNVIIVSAKLDYHIATIAYDLGASYLVKEDVLSENLLEAISVVSGGKQIYSENVQTVLEGAHETRQETGLNQDQYLVLQLMADGCDNQEIVAKTGKSLKAVYSIQQRIREKLDVSSSEQAVVKAIKERIVKLGSWS